jgi:hypothetical protein
LIAAHELADDPEAPLFHEIRPQDNPAEHLHPHSVRQQLKRIARQTDEVDAENISPHTPNHGCASEMRASDRYSIINTPKAQRAGQIDRFSRPVVTIGCQRRLLNTEAEFSIPY